MQAWPMRHSALEFFFYHLAENFVVQSEIGIHFLELDVLFFKFFQAFELTDVEPRILAFPLVQRSPRYVQTPADFVRRHSSFKFIYAFDNFRFGMSQFFHGCSFATKGSILTKGNPFLSSYEQS